MFEPKCSQLTEFLQEFFEMPDPAVARESHFVRRCSKLTAVVFVKTLVFGLLKKGDASLSELSEVAGQFGVKISPSGLAQRLNEAGQAMLQQLLQAAVQQLGERASRDEQVFKGFSAVNIVDSTQIRLRERCRALFAGSGGSGSTASAKIQVSYDYLSGKFNALALGSGNVPDQKCTFPVEYAKPGSLTLFDLGYFKLAALVAIHLANAFFVTRLNTQMTLYINPEGPDKFDLLAYLEAQTTVTIETGIEVSVYVGAEERLPVRVICRKLPAAQGAEKRRQAHAKAKKKKRVCSPTQQRWSAWHCCLTNVPATRWTPQQVLFVYRLRWHIELVFKLWKSQAQLTAVRYERPERVACLLYAHWLGLVIFQALLAPYRAETNDTQLSPVKAFRRFQQVMTSLIKRIAADWETVAARLGQFLQETAIYDQKTKRRQSPSTRQALLAQGI